MPVSGGKYVAPVWQNGGPPALDADELNAISQSIVRNQGGIGDLNTLTQQLSAAIGGAAKVEAGSYVGTGIVGEANKNTIKFSISPAAVLIFPEVRAVALSTFTWNSSNPTLYGGAILIRGVSAFSTYENGGILITWEESSISFFVDTTAVYASNAQLNRNGVTYYYVAIG